MNCTLSKLHSIGIGNLFSQFICTATNSEKNVYKYITDYFMYFTIIKQMLMIFKIFSCIHILEPGFLKM